MLRGDSRASPRSSWLGSPFRLGHEARATFSGEPGLIAFVREAPDGGIFTMDPSGTDLTRLTSGQDYRPKWSPDGTRIVFQRIHGIRSELWVMDADGSNASALGIEGFQPAWSPDGGRIVFGCGRGNPRTEICTANADGTDLQQLTHDREADFLPAWSPDGTTILYTHGFPRSDLYLMGADGSDPTRLTRNRAWDVAEDWSPDGSTILFRSRRHASWDLYTIHADGSELRRVTDGPATEWAAVWSPDGTRIAYTVANYRRGREDIAILNLDDGLVVRFIAADTFDLEPDWQPI